MNFPTNVSLATVNSKVSTNGGGVLVDRGLPPSTSISSSLSETVSILHIPDEESDEEMDVGEPLIEEDSEYNIVVLIGNGGDNEKWGISCSVLIAITHSVGREFLFAEERLRFNLSSTI